MATKSQREQEDANSRRRAKEAESEGQRQEDDDKRRKKRFGIGACIVCCILILVIGLILGLVVFDKDDNDGSSSSSGSSDGQNNGDSPSAPSVPSAQQPSPGQSPITPSAKPPPTRFPSKAPTGTIPPAVATTSAPNPAPVEAPTSELQPTADQFVIIPFADTNVNIDGFDNFEAFGKEDSFLVQNGPEFVNEIPIAYGLLGFELDGIPASASGQYTATLQLTHIPSVVQRGPATLTIVRLPSTRLDIESLHSGLFTPTGGTDGPSFDVDPSDDVIQVDITSLVFPLQEDTMLFLMIENRGIEQPEGAEGDRFRTRESNDPPMLLIGLN
jgi:hypothetical protein